MHEARVRARARALPPAFLEEIARPDLDIKTTHAAIAGLIVLRQVDRWVAGGCRPIEVAGAMRAVEEMEAGNPARHALATVLEAIGGSDNGSPTPNCTVALLEYGRTLELDGRLSLAVAVYGAVTAHAGVAADDAVIATAYLRQGICLRIDAQFERAREASSRARTLAVQLGNRELELRAMLGLAHDDALQGNHEAAEAQITEVIASSPPDAESRVRVMALAARSYVAGLRGHHERSILYGYEALCAEPHPEYRDGILHNIGEAFRLLGHGAAARDTFLVLSCTARRQENRWSALVVLMLLAAEDGDEESFNRYRQELETAELPVTVRVQFLSHLAVAWSALGDSQAAQTARERSERLASEHKVGAQHSLTPRRTAPKQDLTNAHSSGAHDDIDVVVSAIRTLREAADVAG